MDDDDLWIGTYTGGVNVLNTKTGTFRVYTTKGAINGHATAHKMLQQKFPCQSDIFLKGKLILQGNLKAVCQLGVLATLGFLHGVP